MFLGSGHFLISSGVEVRYSWGSWDEMRVWFGGGGLWSTGLDLVTNVFAVLLAIDKSSDW